MLTTSAGGGGADYLTAVLGTPVVWGPVADDLPGARPLARCDVGRMVATDDAVRYEDETVRILVRGTDEVRCEPLGGRRPADVAHYVYGFGAQVLLLHAGRFSIHASSVELPTGTVAVAGDSGAGKSTTSVALAARGGRLLVDDVTALRVAGDLVVVEPFDRPIHLLEDAISLVDTSGFSRLDDRYVVGPEHKTVLGFGGRGGGDAGTAPVPVDLLVVIEPTPGVGPRPVAEEVTGAQRLRWLVRLSNAVGLSSFGSRELAYFTWAAEVGDRLATTVIRRDPEVECVAAVADLIDGILRGSRAASPR